MEMGDRTVYEAKRQRSKEAEKQRGKEAKKGLHRGHRVRREEEEGFQRRENVGWGKCLASRTLAESTELASTSDCATIPPLRGPTRQKAARKKNRAAPVGMTILGGSVEGGCAAPTALWILGGLNPALTGWANLWRASGA